MSNQASFGIAITADDKTAKGAKSAEQRLGQIPKRSSVANKRWADDAERSVGRAGRASIRTLGSVEQAASRVFGGRSITSGLTNRLSALGEVASAAGTGLGEAAGGAGVLSGALGGLGVIATGTIGVLAAAAVGAIDFVKNWAQGAATIGRTADAIGVATKALQEFTAAGERVGVDKASAAGALGSLSQNLNDARYGRNPQLLGVLRKVGVDLKLKQDGTVDVEAMLPALADAMQRQNSSGRRTLSKYLGVQGAMQIFTQGGKSLSSEMDDAGQHAYIASDASIANAKNVQRDGAIVNQMFEKAKGSVGEAGAGVLDKGYQGVISGGRSVIDYFAGTAQANEQAATHTERAASSIEKSAGSMQRSAAIIERTVGSPRAAGRLSARQVGVHGRKAASLVPELMGVGFTEPEAIGVAANVQLESGGDHQSHEKGGSKAGRGLIQWTDQARKALFRRVMGVDVEQSSRDQQLRFIRWETQHSEKKNWARALAGGQDPASIAAGYARYVERPADKDRDSAERAAVADAIPVHVTVELRNAPRGTSASVRAGKSPAPAVSHAMQH